MKKLGLSIMILLMPLIAFADDPVEINGIYYNLTDKMGTAEVVSSPNKYKGNITIPESVTYESKTYKVDRIGISAFESCKYLTSINLPNTIEVIEQSAFKGCYGLNTFTIPDNVKEIGDMAFWDCLNIKSIDIPDKIVKINFGVFPYCRSLEHINLGRNVVYIGNAAFSDCSKLKSIIIPSKVYYLGSHAFNSCIELESIELSESLTYIDNYCFSECTKLKAITIPNSVKTIKFHAFDGCNSLTTIVLGKNVQTLTSKVFANCSEITDVYCYADELSIDKDTFENSYIEYATLHVPSESLDFYRNAYYWKDFKNIVPLTDSDPKPTAITTITMADDNDIKYYTIDGKPISKPQKGINILKYGNGTTKKVVIR
jgi:hypothetical protein